MNGGEIFITISINCLIIYFLHVLHKRSITKTIQHLRKEVNELENLVAAIIEEFEDVADKVLQTEPEKPVEKATDPPAFKGEELVRDEELVRKEELVKVVSNEPLPEILEKKEPPETLPMFQPQEIIDPKHQRIFQLWKDGLAIEEIARQLGTGRGEVQLVLGIYKRS